MLIFLDRDSGAQPYLSEAMSTNSLKDPMFSPAELDAPQIGQSLT